MTAAFIKALSPQRSASRVLLSMRKSKDSDSYCKLVQSMTLTERVKAEAYSSGLPLKSSLTASGRSPPAKCRCSQFPCNRLRAYQQEESSFHSLDSEFGKFLCQGNTSILTASKSRNLQACIKGQPLRVLPVKCLALLLLVSLVPIGRFSVLRHIAYY